MRLAAASRQHTLQYTAGTDAVVRRALRWSAIYLPRSETSRTGNLHFSLAVTQA